MSETGAGAGQDTTFEGWDRLNWRERRARRLRRWIGAKGVPFATASAKSAYSERVQLLIDALRLMKPTRVPVSAIMGFYPTRYGGLSAKEAMYDFEKSAVAHSAFYEHFLPDFQSQPVPPAPVFDRLGLQFVQCPGHGVGDDTPWQYLEAEYMKPE